jgi:CTP synthase
LSLFRRKLALFCQTKYEYVISLHDVSNIYRVPLLMREQNLGKLTLHRLGLPITAEVGMSPSMTMITKDGRASSTTAAIPHPPMKHNCMASWFRLAELNDSPCKEVTIGIVGKYTGLQDSYLSVIKALKHAAMECQVQLTIEWIESSSLEPGMKVTDLQKYNDSWARLAAVDGVLCPGGFGDRGVEGKVLAAGHCRKNKVPYFGICLGMQVAVAAFARDVLGWTDANSTEFNPDNPHPVVIFMPEGSKTQLGGTMRLGARLCTIKDKHSMAYKLYGNKQVHERHRHRYEVNPELVSSLENAGLKFTGKDEQGQRMEIIEIPALESFYLACQFHPEFTSKPMRPNPLFLGFVLGAAGMLNDRLKHDGGRLVIGNGYNNRTAAV